MSWDLRLQTKGGSATELADVLEVSESTLSRLVHEKIDLSPALAVKVSKVLGRSAQSWMAMQANHTLARCEAELGQWTPTRQVTAEGFVAVKGGKSKAKHKAAAKTATAACKAVSLVICSPSDRVPGSNYSRRIT